MDFADTSEQAMLRQSARSFLEDRFPIEVARRVEATGDAGALWRDVAALGWLSCCIEEAEGGAGGSFADLMVLAEEFGRAVFALPVLSTLIGAALPAGEAGSAALRRSLLPAIQRGEAVAVLAARSDIAVRAVGDGLLLDGRLHHLSDADRADWLVCVAGGDPAEAPLALVRRDAPGVSLRPLRVIGRERRFEVSLRDVVVPADHVLRGPGIAARVLCRASLAGCAIMVGGCERILEMTIRHATDRRQFGQPIGSFQAIQHLCADMAVDLANARHLTRAAAWAEDEAAAAAARLWTVPACERICIGAHKVHGAIGLTEEHALSLHSRRLLGLRQEFGEADAWADRLATAMGL